MTSKQETFLEFFIVSESELDGSKMEIISSFLDTKSIDVAQKEAIISLFGRYSWEVLEHDKFKFIKLYSGENFDQKIIVVTLGPTPCAIQLL